MQGKITRGRNRSKHPRSHQCVRKRAADYISGKGGGLSEKKKKGAEKVR